MMPHWLGATQGRRSWAISYERPSLSASRLAPLKTSSTTRALNSALKVHRLLMAFPFLGTILLHLDVCPSLGAHYSDTSTWEI